MSVDQCLRSGSTVNALAYPLSQFGVRSEEGTFSSPISGDKSIEGEISPSNNRSCFNFIRHTIEAVLDLVKESEVLYFPSVLFYPLFVEFISTRDVAANPDWGSHSFAKENLDGSRNHAVQDE